MTAPEAIIKKLTLVLTKILKDTNFKENSTNDLVADNSSQTERSK
jgi:hypothetical protein